MMGGASVERLKRRAGNVVLFVDTRVLLTDVELAIVGVVAVTEDETRETEEAFDSTRGDSEVEEMFFVTARS